MSTLIETSSARVDFTRVRRFSEIWIVKEKFTKVPTLSLPVTIVVESDYRGMLPMSADYANRSVTVKLHSLRDVNVGLSELGESRARTDYEIDRCPRLFCCSRGQFFISGDVKKPFFFN